jgi:hypothetical protein
MRSSRLRLRLIEVFRERPLHEPLLALADLARPVAVDDLDRDRVQRQRRERCEQMPAEQPHPELEGSGPDLVLVPLDPLRREDVEGRYLPRRFDRGLDERLPEAAAHVGEHVLEVLLGLRPRRYVVAEGDVAALPERDEAKRVPATARRFDNAPVAGLGIVLPLSTSFALRVP